MLHNHLYLSRNPDHPEGMEAEPAKTSFTTSSYFSPGDNEGNKSMY
jgi:hypothetical protein